MATNGGVGATLLMSKIKMKNSARKGFSAPLTAIVVTVAMLSLVSLVSVSAFLTIGNTSSSRSGCLDLSTAQGLISIHESIEELSMAPVGTSMTILIDLTSGPIIVANNSIQSDGAIPTPLDYAGIVASFSSNTIIYNSKIAVTPAIITPGLSKITLSVQPEGDGKREICIEVTEA